MHKKGILLFILIILVSTVGASSEADWIADRNTQGSWGNIRETAYSILALDKEQGYENLVLNGSRSLIISLENCMLTNSCNVKDTAVAVLALHEVGNNANIVNIAGTWLLNSRSIVFTGDLPSTSNQWFVQVVSSVAGSCVLTNYDLDSSLGVSVDTSQGYVPWFNVDSGILTSTTSSLNLDCSSLGSTPVLSLINKKDVSGVENYFIKQEEHGKKNITVSFGDPCWGATYRSGSCDTETTGYVLYTLNKIGKSGDPSWLVGQSNLGLKEKAFLFKVTNDNQYLTSLAQEKNSAGFWGTADLTTTVLIYNLLKPNSIISGVDNWVASRRHNDGCWPKPNCNVEQTALVMYGGSYTSSSSGCPDLDGDNTCDSDDSDIDGDGLLNGIDNNSRNPDTNNNGVLDGDDDYDRDGFVNKEDSDIDGDGVDNEDDRDPWDETVGITTRNDPIGDSDASSLGNICTTAEGCEGKRDAIGQCIDVSGDGCPVSDTSSRGEVDLGGTGTTGTSTSGSSDEGRSVLFWSLMVLLMLIILFGGGFLAYKKGLLKLKFGNKPGPQAKYTPRLNQSKPQNYQPRVASTPRKKPGIVSSIEKDLDQSMKDLERLLGKK